MNLRLPGAGRPRAIRATPCPYNRLHKFRSAPHVNPRAPLNAQIPDQSAPPQAPARLAAGRPAPPQAPARLAAGRPAPPQAPARLAAGRPASPQPEPPRRRPLPPPPPAPFRPAAPQVPCGARLPALRCPAAKPAAPCCRVDPARLPSPRHLAAVWTLPGCRARGTRDHARRSHRSPATSASRVSPTRQLQPPRAGTMPHCAGYSRHNVPLSRLELANGIP